VPTAARDREARFTALLHLDLERLWAAYRAINPKAAPGVDQVTWASYGQDLEANLQDLYQRVAAGRYRASPSRRVYIPKADGRQRPLGIAALEDKIVQRAVVEVLGVIYEVDFRGFSYGFRPGRSPHQALDALAVGIERKKVYWVLDADIRDFFGQLDRVWLRRFLEHRIADRRVLRLIGKWLAAGVISPSRVQASMQAFEVYSVAAVAVEDGARPRRCRSSSQRPSCAATSMPPSRRWKRRPSGTKPTLRQPVNGPNRCSQRTRPPRTPRCGLALPSGLATPPRRPSSDSALPAPNWTPPPRNSRRTLQPIGLVTLRTCPTSPLTGTTRCGLPAPPQSRRPPSSSPGQPRSVHHRRSSRRVARRTRLGRRA
jgi:hypothetical protein